MESRSLLTVLTRLAQRRPAAEEWLRAAFHARLDLLAESALEVAVETGDPIGLGLAREIAKNAGEDLAGRLMKRCEENRFVLSLPLREVALAATTRKRHLFLQRHGPRRHWRLLAVVDESAYLANSLGIRLSELGRRKEALKATKEAAAIYRDLAGQRPDDYLPAFAMNLNNLGNALSARLGATLRQIALDGDVFTTLPQEVCQDGILHELRQGRRIFDALAKGGRQLLGERDGGLDFHTASVRLGAGDVNAHIPQTRATA